MPSTCGRTISAASRRSSPQPSGQRRRRSAWPRRYASTRRRATSPQRRRRAPRPRPERSRPAQRDPFEHLRIERRLPPRWEHHRHDRRQLGAWDGGERKPLNDRIAERVLRSLVEDRLVFGWIELQEALDEERQAPHARNPLVAPLADEADLPQDQERAGVDRPAAHEEVRRLVALAAADRRIEAQIGDEAVRSRDPGQHPRAEAVGAQTPDRLVSGPREHAGMPVQHEADIESLSDAADDLLDDREVDLPSVLALLVERRKRTRV